MVSGSSSTAPTATSTPTPTPTPERRSYSDAYTDLRLQLRLRLRLRPRLRLGLRRRPQCRTMRRRSLRDRRRSPTPTSPPTPTPNSSSLRPWRSPRQRAARHLGPLRSRHRRQPPDLGGGPWSTDRLTRLRHPHRAAPASSSSAPRHDWPGIYDQDDAGCAGWTRRRTAPGGT